MSGGKSFRLHVAFDMHPGVCLLSGQTQEPESGINASERKMISGAVMSSGVTMQRV